MAVFEGQNATLSFENDDGSWTSPIPLQAIFRTEDGKPVYRREDVVKQTNQLAAVCGKVVSVSVLDDRRS